MGKIYTSYFGNYRNFPKGSLAVSITQYLVNNIKVDLEYREVAPGSHILAGFKGGLMSEKEYRGNYLKQLSKIDFDSFLKFLVSESRDKDVLLLCYEKKNAFCHRHILASVINKVFKRNNLAEIGEL